MSKSALGVVILNYGSPGDSIRLASSLRQIDKAVFICIVDNFSTADNLEELRQFVQESPESFFFIENERNDGYGYGNNLGFRFLFEELLCDACIAINPDVELDRRFSLDGVRAESWEEECVFTGVISQHGVVSSVYVFNPYFFFSHRLEQLGDFPAKPVYVSGCLWGISRPMWARTNGFSTQYFLYFEELDFIYRYWGLQKRFPKLRVISSMRIKHLEGGSTGASPDGHLNSPFADYWSSRSRIMFARTHLRRRIVLAVAYNLCKALMMLYKFRWENVRNIIKGTANGLCCESK